MNRYLPLVGRVLIGLPFVMNGLGKLAAYGPTTAMIGAAGLPLPPLAYLVAVVLELGGGLLLFAGYQVRPVALVWQYSASSRAWRSTATSPIRTKSSTS
jgi:putative oxidoreductase